MSTPEPDWDTVMEMEAESRRDAGIVSPAALLAGIRERAEGPMRKFRDVDASQRDVATLLAAIEALTAALTRHRPWFVNGEGVKICGGCLDPAPCKYDPDVIVARALSGKDSSDGK